jgi:MOSC domain-containing protein YiiM
VANARVISVNAGRIRAAGWARPIQRTAIDKRPAGGPLAIGRLGVHGDEQADRKHHGGVEQAVYAYAREDLDWWVEQLGLELGNGTFGENLTTAGLDVSGALLGETWQVGTAVVQVRSVRIPCGVFAGWMGEQYAAQRAWIKRFAAAGRPGAYLKVLTEGSAGPGDPIEVLRRPVASVTVAEAMRAYYGDPDLMRRLVAVQDRDPKWDDVAAEVLSRAAARQAG